MSKPHIEHEAPVQDGLSRTLKDLFAGAVGGVAQVLIGQPFDLLKAKTTMFARRVVANYVE